MINYILLKYYDWKWCYRFKVGWWRFVPSTKVLVTINWPIVNGSNDPHEYVRPWLEENVGEQHKKWDWCCGQNNQGPLLHIWFSKKKDAILFRLTF
ncbi:MAG: hypothetical protein HC836_40855 [Richelia sp. RM2_1_2]|nr:hypothetical protein [Richelia sp. RM2_1_2]